MTINEKSKKATHISIRTDVKCEMCNRYSVIAVTGKCSNSFCGYVASYLPTQPDES